MLPMRWYVQRPVDMRRPVTCDVQNLWQEEYDLSGIALSPGMQDMNPFELFQSSGIYKLAMLYFSRSRGLAIVGRCTVGDNVEVIQISGEVDPHTGNFTALDYPSSARDGHCPVVSKRDFENLVSFIAAKIDDQTRMSVIDPELMQSAISQSSSSEPNNYIH